ncbi:MAG: hypothetical protein P8Y13_13810 [Deinococcales bacterium]
MKGYGITAGPGNELVRFSVEVLSIQADAGPGFPLVLVRASGDFIDSSGGVAAGMSGSPVYLSTSDGPALLGAIGYVFPSADHHLALVTPIAVMRAEADGSTASGSSGPVAVAGVGRAVPAATPILLSGANARTAALLEPLFRDGRVAPLPAQASGSLPASGEPAYTLTPGSPISVELVRGDVTIGAIGTVTAVDGKTLLAFGHPLLGIGTVSLPVAPAFVTAMVPSTVVPFKLANSGQKPLGTISQDRPATIAGTLGDGPTMIPVSLTIDTPSKTATYHVDVARDERLYPQLVAAASQQLLDQSLSETTGGYAQVGWEIDLSGGERLNLVEQADDPSDIAKATAQLIGSPLHALATNVFQAPGVQAVKLNVRLSTQQSTAGIVDVVAENPKVKPGTSVVVHVRLQPYRQEPLVKTLSVKVPADASSGTLTLTFRGGDVTPKGDTSKPNTKNRPRSFPELLDALRQKPQASELVVEAPGKDGAVQRLARLSLPFVVTGSQTLDVTVENGKANPAKTPPAQGENGGGTPSGPSSQPPDLNQPPGATPPTPPEGPKPNGDGSTGGTSTGATGGPR